MVALGGRRLAEINRVGLHYTKEAVRAVQGVPLPSPIQIQGGGVALFLTDDLTCGLIGSLEYGVCELLVVHIHQLNTLSVASHRPPDTKIAEFTPV